MYLQEQRFSLPSHNPQQSYQQYHQSHIQPGIIYSDKKLQNINCIEESSSGYGGLYLGDIISVVKPEIIHSNNITAILSCIS